MIPTGCRDLRRALSRWTCGCRSIASRVSRRSRPVTTREAARSSSFSADGETIVTTSLPAYVKSLIENKTHDKGAPDQETVWGAIPDDEKFVYPTTFF